MKQEKRSTTFGRGDQTKKPAQFALVFRVDKPTEDAKPLHDLTIDMCRWPLWDRWSRDALFCGKPSIDDSPYCRDHFRRSYTPVIRGVKIERIVNEK